MMDKGRRKMPYHRRKVCRYCADSSLVIDYKDPRTLRLFTTERGKIIPRRISGNCAKHQRMIGLAIKRGSQHRPPALHDGYRQVR